MSRIYAEAFDKNNYQILGNLDGQGVIGNSPHYRRTKKYKALSTRKTLNNRVKYYLVVNDQGQVLERINNSTFKEV